MLTLGWPSKAVRALVGNAQLAYDVELVAGYAGIGDCQPVTSAQRGAYRLLGFRRHDRANSAIGENSEPGGWYRGAGVAR